MPLFFKIPTVRRYFLLRLSLDSEKVSYQKESTDEDVSIELTFRGRSSLSWQMSLAVALEL